MSNKEIVTGGFVKKGDAYVFQEGFYSTYQNASGDSCLHFEGTEDPLNISFCYHYERWQVDVKDVAEITDNSVCYLL